jgi:PEP-CTERM motif
VNGLDTDMANNVGPNDETFFSGTLPAYPSTPGGAMTFTIASPFLYDPSAGNLLLDIQISGVTNGSTALFVAQDGDFGTDSSRMVNGNAEGTSSYGLVTTFGLGTTSVPEPGSLTLAMIGLAAVAGLSRLRRHRA